MAKGSNKAALDLQRQSLAESRKASKRMAAMAKAQLAAIEGMEPPKLETPGPAPTRSSVDLEREALAMRNKMSRRKGLNTTTFAGANGGGAAA